MCRTSLRLVALFAPLVLAWAGPASAWPTESTQNAAVAKGAGNQEFGSMTPDGSGGAFIAWTDSSNQFTGYDIRVSHLRANGTLDPAWPAAGVNVCMATGDQSWPFIVADGSGGALVTWSDRRSGTNWDVYAHHVLPSGAVDSNWPVNGAIVCAMPGDQYNTEQGLVSDGSGGAIAAWHDYRNGIDSDIYAHHITTTGMDAAWGAQGRPLCTASGNQGVTTIVSDGAGGAIVAWNDTRAGNFDVYAMRVLSDGSLAPGWTTNGVPIAAGAFHQTNAVALPDGQHGAYLAWQDQRNGVDYDIYYQRVLATGALSSSLPATGAALCIQPGIQARPMIVSDGSGGALVEWHDKRDGANSAVYVNHATATGADGSWPANGLAVRIETGEYFQGLVSFRGFASDGAGGAIAAWQDHRNGEWDVYAMHVLSSGSLDPGWPDGGRAVSTASDDQDSPTALASNGGRTILAWFDHRAGDWDLYAQGLTPGGDLGIQMLAANPPLPQLQGGSLAWGDYDNDGDLDLLMTGMDASTPHTYLLRNDGGGVFTQVATSLPAIAWSSVQWGDYDADGDLDIAMCGWTGTSGLARIYRNDGPLGFTNIGAVLPALSHGTVAWGDVDGDGDLDLLLAGMDNSNVSFSYVYLNNAGTFTDGGFGLTGVSSCGGAWGDFDADGDLDLLLSGYTGSGRLLRVYVNYAGTLNPIDIGAPNVEGLDQTVAWGDYDHDGDLDILLSGWDGSARHLAVYQNIGAGFFFDAGVGLPGINAGAVAWGDYDNDGDLDILASGYSDANAGLTRIYRNENGTFVDAHAGLPDLLFSAVAWADWDGDGDLDPIVSGTPNFTSATTALFRNDGATPDTPPAAPTNLSAERNGDYVVFHWTPSTDAETPSAGLSYNLRVGTTSGSDYPVTSMSRSNGFRKVVRTGNAGQVSTFAVKLPGQPFSWSVQAVDGAFTGSPFATEAHVADVPGGPIAGPEGLRAPSPNPFRGETRLAWALARSGPVELTIHDLSGRRVRTLASGVREAGPASATWDGRDDGGRALPPGLYVVHLSAAGTRWSSKVVLTR